MFAFWKKGMTVLAACPNVSVNLGGLTMLLVAPVEKMGIGYAGLLNALKHMAAGASAEEKCAIFSGTAARAYRLNL